ncbi:MAG: nucleoside triphosphate pyrophosphohydrolase [Oscillatoria sp. SIO1A7]|nr:nucleoside triphosphate pyrophosphohydrolase [Oscillatoria sp. SIO1A7]
MSNPSLSPELVALQRLIEIVAKLRSPDGGCPWDLAQTPETLIPHVIEEAYETVDAIRSGDKEAIAEELGDLLLQVVLQAQIASDRHQFTIAKVANGIADKMIRRHPHIFDNLKINGIDDVRQNWEEIKAAEKGETQAEAQRLTRKLDRYARSLPPLMAGMKISQKAAAASFEWDSVEGVWEKFQEELAEFQYAIDHEDKERQEAELGDLLFVVINLARWYGLDPSAALQQTNHRFIHRLAKVEEFADRPLNEYSAEELDRLWERAKAQLAQQSHNSHIIP